MALEHYKTQVLLLHSEQSTLDKLSSGFSDRFTVHCATSGTEALNTLVDTPIHVLVSAHDLPGMSGLDALREARKRSPETIGILLAGTDKQDGLEALVGDEEVFQIVRGEIAPPALRDLIENATKRVRLSTLSQSANDHSADLDAKGAEHIVMETSANGSTIISDGTGSMPALKPQKIQVSPDAGGRGVDVLVLSRDEEFLVTVRDSARGMHEVHHASTVGEAEEIAKQNKVGVLVTDAAMVGSNVEALTYRLRADVPRLVAIVAGRRDDGEMLMDLINRGQVYRFLLKPVSPGRARLAIEASVKHHLDAPDAAFAHAPARVGGAGTKGGSQGAAGAAPDQAGNHGPRSAQQRRAAARPPAKSAAARLAPRQAPTFSAMPMDDDFDDPFGESSSFTETMTGIVTSVGKSISNAAGSLKITGRSKAPAPAKAAKAEAATNPPARIEPQVTPTRTEPPQPAPRSVAPEPAKKIEPPKPTKRIEPPPRRPRIEPIAVSEAATPPREAPRPEPAAAAAAPSASPAGGKPASRVTKILAAVAVLAIAAAGVVWLQGGEQVTIPVQVTEEAPAARVTTPSFAESDLPLSAQPRPGADLMPLQDDVLAQARAALAAGQLLEPPGANAVDLYMAAQASAPNDFVIAAEIEQMADELFSLTEQALLEQRSADAAAALSKARLTSPDSPRLAFLEAQLSQMQLRQSLDEARAAIRQDRFEDAANFLQQAEAAAQGDSSEIALLAEELTVARSEQRIGDVLEMAHQRLDENRLTSPSNDNARYYFELALDNDPQHTAAVQGLMIVAGKLVLRAREAIDDGNFADADKLLADARALDPASAELAAASLALQSAKDERAAAERQAEAARQAEIERRAAAEQEANERRLAELEQERLAALEAERQAAELEARRQATASAAEAAAATAALTPDSSAGGAAASSFAARGVTEGADVPAGTPGGVPAGTSSASATQPADAAGVVAADTTLLAAAAAARTTLDLDSGPPAAPAGGEGTRSGTQAIAQRGGPELVAISTLIRSNYVAPKYPRSAMRRNITGSVDVSFTVRRDGSVDDVKVIESTPGSVFNQAAINAVQQWQFEPIVEGGEPVEKRRAVRMAFDLQ